ncbi:MAG: peptidase M20, partial [Sphingomicrobium sp.]
MSKSRWLSASVVALSASPLAAASIGGFSPYRLSEIVKTISADNFEGRGVNTPAETKTLNYIIDQLRSAGLEPGGDAVGGKRKWTQDVPLRQSDITGTPQVTLSLGNGQSVPLTQGDQIAVRSPMNGRTDVNLNNVPLVFVGYGVAAPERNWDDFKGQDLKGKLLVVLVNDPDFEGGEG